MFNSELPSSPILLGLCLENIEVVIVPGCNFKSILLFVLKLRLILVIFCECYESLSGIIFAMVDLRGIELRFIWKLVADSGGFPDGCHFPNHNEVYCNIIYLSIIFLLISWHISHSIIPSLQFCISMQNIQQFNEDTLTQNIIAQRSPVSGSTIFYVHVHKQSQTGLLFNQRMLVAQDQHFTIFYSKHLRPIDRLVKLQQKGLIPIKQYLHIINTHAQIDNNIVTVRFIKDSIKKCWVFRFNTQNIANKWYVLYKDLYERSIAKSINSKSKQTASDSSNLSEYASVVSIKMMEEEQRSKEQYNSGNHKSSTLKIDLTDRMLYESAKASNQKL